MYLKVDVKRCVDRVAHRRLIGAVEESIEEQVQGSVRYKTVALHFAETDAAAAFATFDRLVCQDVHGADAAHLELVRHHVA